MFRKKNEREFFKGVKFKKKEMEDHFKKDLILWKMRIFHECSHTTIKVKNLLLGKFRLPIVIVSCYFDNEGCKMEFLDNIGRNGSICFYNANASIYYLSIINQDEERTYKCQIKYSGTISVMEETISTAKGRKIQFIFGDNTEIIVSEDKSQIKIWTAGDILNYSTIEQVSKKIDINCSMKELVSSFSQYFNSMNIEKIFDKDLISKIMISERIVILMQEEGKIDTKPVSVEFFYTNKEKVTQ